MSIVADDLAAWLISLLADAGRRKLTAFLLGSDQERAIESACRVALSATASELCSHDPTATDHMAMVIGEVFRAPVVAGQTDGRQTLLEELQAGIAARLAVLDDRDITTKPGFSSADALQVSATAISHKLAVHLFREITLRGARGGALEPLANQLAHDRTYLQQLRLEGKAEYLSRLLVTMLGALGDARRAFVVPSALAQLPAEAAVFAGRDDELALLVGLLEPTTRPGPVVVSAVAGLAGVGKTTLAIQAGHAAVRSGWFRGGVLFMDLHGYDDQPVQAGQALGTVLRALNVPASDIPPSTAERAALYRSVLARIDQPVLILADNAATEAQVRPLVPGTGPHKVLVTTRHTLAGLGGRLVDIASLNEDAATELLNASLTAARPDDDRISAHPKAAGELAKACGGLPLALQITAAILKTDMAMSAGELASQLSNESKRLERLRYNDGSGSAAPSVAAAFWLSYRRLDETLARVFRLLPLNPGPDLSAEAVSVLSGLPLSDARAALASLTQAHLAELAHTGPGRWRLHDLVRLYADQTSNRDANANDREQAQRQLLNYYLTGASAADRCLWALCETDPTQFTSIDEALAWLDAERANLVGAVTSAASTDQDEFAIRLASVLWEFLTRRRLWDDHVTVSTAALNAARASGDRNGEVAALDGLGIAHGGARRYEQAIGALEESISISRNAEDIYGEMQSQSNLGLVLTDAGQLAKAIGVLQAVVAWLGRFGDWQGQAMALVNLGKALRLSGNLNDAYDAFLRAFKILRSLGDRHNEGRALHNIGTVLLQANRIDQAVKPLQDAIACFHEMDDRYDEAMATSLLGTALKLLGRFDEAIKCHQMNTVVFAEVGERRDEAIAFAGLGDALKGSQRLDEAITAYQKAIAIYGEIGDQQDGAGFVSYLHEMVTELQGSTGTNGGNP